MALTPPTSSVWRRTLARCLALATLIAAGGSVAPAAVAAAPAARLDAGGWTTEVTFAPASPRPGDRVVITAHVTALQSNRALIDLEVFDEHGGRLTQRFWDDVPVAGSTVSLATAWTVPPGFAGSIRAAVGVFQSGWGALHHWNEYAGQAAVLPATTTVAPTTATAPTTTVAATTTTVSPTTTSPASTTTTAGPATTTSTTPADVQFAESFETSAALGRFRYDVHLRDASNVSADSWMADHNMGCEGPDTQRAISSHDTSSFFFYCAPRGPETGHLMSTMSDIDGYTILSFSPDRSFTDFSRVCWDVNLTDLGGRKWTQVVIVPEAAFRAHGERLDYISPVTQDVDQTAIPMPAGALMFQNWDHAFRVFAGQTELLDDWNGFAVTDKAKRYKHCMVDNGDGTITMEQERANGATYTQTVRGSFPDQGRVIFQDDNYTPLKDGPIAGFTWHWDNIQVS